MDARSQALTALSQFLVTSQSFGETLTRVAEITTDAMPAAEMAGIMMLGESGKPTTAIFTDEAAPEIDESQYRSGRGPCLDAWRRKEVVTIGSIDGAKGEYPEFATACKQHGILSTLSLPLVVGDVGIGALNLYAGSTDGFTSDDEALGTELAATAAIVLANASAYWDAFTLSEQLSAAMASRATIEQAKGILMSRSNITPDEAFDLLRKASQRENVKLRDIAQRIVTNRDQR
jgi:GAF domain-containing protein